MESKWLFVSHNSLHLALLNILLYIIVNLGVLYIIYNTIYYIVYSYIYSTRTLCVILELPADFVYFYSLY